MSITKSMKDQTRKKVPTEILEKYALPEYLSDFQLGMFIHLIEWKWNNLTREKGNFRGRDYDSILPESLQQKWLPLYPAIVDEVRKLDFKKHRHFGHMASSQVACLNLFFPLLRDKETANQVFPLIKPDFRELATCELKNGYSFEYCHESNPLNDHTPHAGTDADVAIAYYNTSGELSLWLIEHKLTEDEFTTCGGYRTKHNKSKGDCESNQLILNDHNKCYYTKYCNYKYWEISDRSGMYDPISLSKKMKCPFLGGENQLWRNQLLGYAVKEKGHFKKVHFSVVHHPDNPDLARSMNSYSQLLKNMDIFSSYTSKDFIRAASSINDHSIQSWIKWYSELYRI